MKILFISGNDWVPWGGSEELWHRAALQLCKNGHEVAVHVKKWNPRPKHIELLVAAGCQVCERTVKHRATLLTKAGAALWRATGTAADYQELNRLLGNFSPNLAIINQGAMLDGANEAALCRRQRIPYAIVAQLVRDRERLNLLTRQTGRR